MLICPKYAQQIKNTIKKKIGNVLDCVEEFLFVERLRVPPSLAMQQTLSDPTAPISSDRNKRIEHCQL